MSSLWTCASSAAATTAALSRASDRKRCAAATTTIVTIFCLIINIPQALKLIKQHKNIEGVIAQMRKEKKFDIPPDWLPMRVPKTVAPIAEEQDGEEIEPDANVDKAADLSIDSAHTEGNVEDDCAAPTKEAVQETTTTEDGDAEAKEGEETDMSLGDTVEPAAVEEGEFEEVPPLYVQARKLFLECEVHCADNIELKWQEPDVPGLSTFLVDRMGFNPDRVASGIKKLKEAQLQKSQQRMDW